MSTNDELARSNKTRGLADKTVMIRPRIAWSPLAQSRTRDERGPGETRNNPRETPKTQQNHGSGNLYSPVFIRRLGDRHP
jgi:hypothetical protein